LTWEELKEKGLSLNDKGLWTTNTGDEEVVEVQESEEVEA
jgi:hypothetical protein